jgi:hypothetical protein
VKRKSVIFKRRSVGWNTAAMKNLEKRKKADNTVMTKKWNERNGNKVKAWSERKKWKKESENRRNVAWNEEIMKKS